MNSFFEKFLLACMEHLWILVKLTLIFVFISQGVPEFIYAGF